MSPLLDVSLARAARVALRGEFHDRFEVRDTYTPLLGARLDRHVHGIVRDV
jgi:hypothetical protein